MQFTASLPFSRQCSKNIERVALSTQELRKYTELSRVRKTSFSRMTRFVFKVQSSNSFYSLSRSLLLSFFAGVFLFSNCSRQLSKFDSGLSHKSKR